MWLEPHTLLRFYIFLESASEETEKKQNLDEMCVYKRVSYDSL